MRNGLAHRESGLVHVELPLEEDRHAFGGGMRVAPDASYDDGLLDVVILHRVSRAEFVRVFPRVFTGTHVTHPQVQVLRGRRIRLEAPGIITQADGERFEPLPLDLEVAPGALMVVT